MNYESNVLSALYGLKMISNPHLTIPGDLVKVRRTWKERLFSRPWMPRVRSKWKEGPRVPSPDIYLLGSETIVAHPETMKKVAAAIEAEEMKRIVARGGI